MNLEMGLQHWGGYPDDYFINRKNIYIIGNVS